MNFQYKKTFDTLKNITDNLYDNIDKFNDLIDIHENTNSKKNLINNLEKKDFSFYSCKESLFKNTKLILNKGNNFVLNKYGDICLGFQTNEDCNLKLLLPNNDIYENIICKKNIITYLENPYFIIHSFYDELRLISDRNIDVNIISVFINNTEKLYLAQNNFTIFSKVYSYGMLRNFPSNNDLDSFRSYITNNNIHEDFSFFNLKNYNIKRK